MSIFRNLLMSKKSRLPSAYQEVEWIKSTGTQYIDSDVNGDGTTGWEITASWQIDSTSSAMIGNFIWAGNNAGGFYAPGGDPNVYFQYAGSGSYQAEYICGDHASMLLKRKYSFNAEETNTFKIEDVTILNNVTGYNTSSSYYIFASHRKGVTQPFVYSTCTIYGCKFYKNNVLIRNLVPCYRKNDGVIGMFDTINKRFFVNQGTGTFEKGGDI